MATHDSEKIGFMTLPREIRDQIYLDLVVSEHPIQIDPNFETLTRSNTFANTALMWMFEAESNSQIAQETREAFYQQNTFLIYTHDIPIFIRIEDHTMSFEAEGSSEPKIYSTQFKPGDWVRNLAVRVGWHTSGGWFPDTCCLNPGQDLRVLLDWDSLRSVIIDARFGSWSYGYPQGIGWKLLRRMNRKWGKDFKIYNDEVLSMDTQRYTSDRRDLSVTFDPQDSSSEESEDEKVKSEDDEQEHVYEDGDEGLWEDIGTESGDGDEELWEDIGTESGGDDEETVEQEEDYVGEDDDQGEEENQDEEEVAGEEMQDEEEDQEEYQEKEEDSDGGDQENKEKAKDDGEPEDEEHEEEGSASGVPSSDGAEGETLERVEEEAWNGDEARAYELTGQGAEENRSL